MKPGVDRFLHAHERVQVAQLLGLPDPGKAATPGCYGWVYDTMTDAEQYTAGNRADGHEVHGPTMWEGRPVSLLVPNGVEPPIPWWRVGAEQQR